MSAASDTQSHLAARVDQMGPGMFAASRAVLITAAVAVRMILHRRAVRPPGLAPADSSKCSGGWLSGVTGQPRSRMCVTYHVSEIVHR